MNKGFFEEGKNNGYECLENLDFEGSRDAYKFLHGYCDEFAGVLSDRFGYKIVTAIEGGFLTHAFAMTEQYGKKIYIDIRGYTDDIGEIMEEFEDYSTEYLLYVFGTKGECDEFLEKELGFGGEEFFEGLEERTEEINLIVDNFIHYYEVKEQYAV